MKVYMMKNFVLTEFLNTWYLSVIPSLLIIAVIVMGLRKYNRFFNTVGDAIASQEDIATLEKAKKSGKLTLLGFMVILAGAIVMLRYWVTREMLSMFAVTPHLLLIGIVSLITGLCGMKYAKKVEDLKVASDDPDITATYTRWVHESKRSRKRAKLTVGIVLIGSIAMILAIPLLAPYIFPYLPNVSLSRFLAPIDHSHTLEEAIAHGVPSLEQDWQLEEYQQFLTYLQTLQPAELPGLESPRSGPLFTKCITSVELTLRAESADDAWKHLQRLTALNETLSGMLAAYQTTTLERIDRTLEMAHLEGISYQIGFYMAQAANNVAAISDQNSPGSDLRMSGLETVQLGLSFQIDTWVMAMETKHFKNEKERLILAQYLLECVPIINGGLERDIQIEIKDTVARVREGEDDKHVQKVLDQILATLVTSK